MNVSLVPGKPCRLARRRARGELKEKPIQIDERRKSYPIWTACNWVVELLAKRPHEGGEERSRDTTNSLITNVYHCYHRKKGGPNV